MKRRRFIASLPAVTLAGSATVETPPDPLAGAIAILRSLPPCDQECFRTLIYGIAEAREQQRREREAKGGAR